MPRRASWKMPLALAALLALAGHAYYWYWPRERPVDPTKAGPAADPVWADEGLPMCFWAPYPHQNLAGLARSDSRLSELVQAFETLRGARREALPAFGPFALPPSHGLGLCSDERGDRLLVVAELYPALGLVARLAGRLAENPWLAGGRVETGGRVLEVGWRDGVWTVRTPGTTAPLADPGSRPESVRGAGTARVLGLARLREGWGVVPPDLYRIDRTGADLRLSSAHLAPGELDAIAPSDPPIGNGISLLATVVEAASEPDVEVMAMVESVGSGELLPTFVVLHHGPGERWRLPREALAPLLGAEPLESSVDGWRVAAMTPEELARAEALVPALRPLDSPAVRYLVAAVWLDPGRVGATLRSLADDLERLPVVKRRHVRAWRAAAMAAGALEGAELVRVIVVGGSGRPGLEVSVRARPRYRPAED